MHLSEKSSSQSTSEQHEQMQVEAFAYPMFESVDDKQRIIRDYYDENHEFDEWTKIERNTETLEQATGEYAKIIQDTTELDPITGLAWLANAYLKYGTDNDDYSLDPNALQSQAQILKTLHARDSEAGIDVSQKPELTVFIPVAILSEDTETVLRTLAEVKKQSIAQGLEVVLWANYKRGAEDATDTLAEEKLQAITEQLTWGKGDPVLRTMVVSYEDKNLQMSKLRKDAMDALLWDGVARGYSYDHPVTWLDADVMALRDDTLERLSAQVKIRDGEAVTPMAIPTTVYRSAENNVQPKSVESIAALHELIRRRMLKLENSFSDEEHKQLWEGPGLTSLEINYPEESGFTFNLGTYAAINGGINDWKPFGEALSMTQALLKSAPAVESIIKALYTGSKQLESKAVRTKGARLAASNRRKIVNLHALSVADKPIYKKDTKPALGLNLINPVITYKQFEHADTDGLADEIDTDTINALVDRFYSVEQLGLEETIDNPSPALLSLRKYIARVIKDKVAKP